ncbi:MAG: sigma-70 family RNA polymerase sigma factor [Cytophagaceae bacterium]|jgi:RNA polymerase sigma-70 factor (ECF subfamily)|nr:sigma-70 family RNA polymerase sigma factor [Cytophagaceae bacterium]
MIQAELIRQCLENKPSAQKELYKTLASKLYAVCLRYTRSKDEAQDWLQEGFIKIFTHLHSFKFEGPFEGWARRIVVNHILSELRKVKNRGNFADLDSVFDLQSSEAGPQDQLQLNDALQLLNHLPEGKRVIFNLFVIEGFSHKEIAEMLSISEGTSKSQLNRAKDILVELHKKFNGTLHEKNSGR